MITKLLSEEVQSFLRDHHSADAHQLLLKYRTISGMPASLVVEQLIGRRKAEERFPTWYQTKDIIYPPALNLEQSSSEKSALAKVDLLKARLGDLRHKTLLDLTGGFGVDSYFFSKAFERINIVEQNSNLIEITKHNHHQLGALNIEYYNTSAENFLENSLLKSADVIFIDPSRRITGNKKVFSLNESVPNILLLQNTIWKLAPNVLIKSSPLLDIQVGLRELNFVQDIWITSINNECKELLFFGERSFESEPTVTAINVNGLDENFSFRLSEERRATIEYSDPMTFIYEPNASLLKAGAFKILGSVFDFCKLQPNTHLFTSSSFNDKFPGRVFEVESAVKPDSKKLKDYFPEGKANIFTRNYPLSVDQIRKKYALKDGGDRYLIGCSGKIKKFLLVAKRVR